jgi:heme A synthase
LDRAAAIVGGSMILGVGSGVVTFVMNVFLGVILGFIGGAIAAFIYNIALAEMGGIEVELEAKQ